MTEWRVIPQYDRYEASDDGRIRRADSGRELAQTANRKGYLTVEIAREWGSGRRPRMVHRLVALAFYGPQPTAHHTDVAHWDGNPANNTLKNLRWATRAENFQDETRLRQARCT